MRYFSAVLAAMCLALYGCGGGNGGRDFVCTTSIEPGIIVSATDAVSGASIAEGATVVITDGDYTETLREQNVIPNPDGTYTVVSYGGALERVGTYTIRVTRMGYAPAERTGVRVTRNDCHVNRQEITIALTPVVAQ